MVLRRSATDRAPRGRVVLSAALLIYLPSACNKPVQPTAQEPSASRAGVPASPTSPDLTPPETALPSAPHLPFERPLTLATWNLEWLAQHPGAGPVARSAEAYRRLAKYATRLNADVIAVQEVESAVALGRVFDASRYVFHLTGDATPQRTGFVYDKRLTARVYPDFTPLGAAELRSGADLSVVWRGKEVRFLSVHLKSGCFDEPLERNDACRKLKAQVPVLERWMDARAEEGTSFAVLGDFNRRLFASKDDPVWRSWDDLVPPESDLFSPTAGERSRCWGDRHPDFIDHLVLSRTLARDWVSTSFEQLTYDADDRPYRAQLSDHCPIRLTLSTDDRLRRQEPDARTSSPPTAEAEARHATWIKGNVSRKKHKYYHAPGCPNFTQVKIDEEKGEALFPNEAAARAAGFERAPDCPRP